MDQPISNFHIAIQRTCTSFSETLASVSILGDHSSAKLLSAILDELQPCFAKDVDVTVMGFSINAVTLHRLTEVCSWLDIRECRFANGWWKSTSTTKRCQHLRIQNCFGVNPEHLEFGEASWPALNCLTIQESIDTSHIPPKQSLCSPPAPANVEDCANFSSYLAKAFWSDGLTSLYFLTCKSIEWILGFPTAPQLEDFYASGTAVSPELFEWICRHKRLKWLVVWWEEGISLPWQFLRQLPRLRRLDVSSTFLTDKELQLISESTSLTYLTAYYTNITAACWNTVLTWPSLRYFWASQEAMEGQFPTEFPKEVGLKEVVALNAHTDMFREFFSRYPEVQIVQM